LLVAAQVELLEEMMALEVVAPEVFSQEPLRQLLLHTQSVWEPVEHHQVLTLVTTILQVTTAQTPLFQVLD
jgi:hypothetical protein